MKKHKNTIIRILMTTASMVLSFVLNYIYIVKTIGLNGIRYSLTTNIPDMRGWVYVIFSTVIFTLVLYIFVVDPFMEKHHFD